MSRPQPNSTLRIVLLSTGAIALLALLGMLVLRCSGVSVWDDAYFFTRYADHFIAEGQFSWNAGEAPVYGTTSVAHLAWVTALRKVLADEPAIPLYISSMLMGFLALAGVFWLVTRYAHEYRKYDLSLMAFFFAALVLNVPQVSAHFSSGMDTMMAMAFLAVYLSLVKQFEAHMSPGKSLVLGVLGGFAWFVRPELLIFTVGIPLAITLFSRRGVVRTQGLYTLLFLAFALLTQALLAEQFFDSMFPLSLAAKNSFEASADLQDAYRWQGLHYLGVFALTNVIPLGLIILGMLQGMKQWWGMLGLVDRAMLVCLLAYFLFQTLGVLPVMGYHQRFLYPVWPALMYLGGRSLAFVLYANPGWMRRWLPAPGTVAALLPALLVAGGTLLACWWWRPSHIKAAWMDFSIANTYKVLGQHNWPGLLRVSQLPEDVSMAATELGILSALNPDRKVYDMTGLHDKKLAQEGLWKGKWLNADMIYLPHPDYHRMRTEILLDSSFNRRYQVYPAAELKSWLGIAVRKTSPHFGKMTEIVQEELQKK